jgi:hypothetical protein
VLKVFLLRDVPGRRNFTALLIGDLLTEVRLVVVGLLKMALAFALEFGGCFWGETALTGAFLAGTDSGGGLIDLFSTN